MSEELSLSFEEHKDFVDNSGDLMQSVALDGRFRYVNNAWLRILGYSRPQVSKMTIWDIIHPDEIEHCQELFMRVMSGEDVGLVTTTFMARDGRKVFVEGNVNCHFADGKPVYTRAIFRDITERKRIEEEYENIFNLSPDMVGIFTTEGELVKVNHSWETILGYKTEELLKMGWAKLVHPDDVERTNKEVAEQLKGSPAVNFINRYKCKDGSYKTLEWQATFAKEGIVYATARDITERKQAEEEIRKFKTITEKANYGIAMINAETNNIVYTNKTFARMHGYADDQLIGCHYSVLFTEEQLKEVEKLKEEVLTETDFGTRELWRKRHDGTVFPTITQSIVVKDEDGKPLFIAATARDITERKQAEEEIRKFKTITDEANYGIAMLDAETNNIIYTNKTFARMHGYADDQLIGCHYSVLFTEEQLKEADSLRKQLQSTGKPLTVEIGRKKKDGTVFPTITQTIVVKDDKGKPWYIAATAIDITERKQAEEEIRKFKIISDSAGYGAAIASIEGELLYLNEAYAQMHGYTIDELIGKHYSILYTEESLQDLERFRQTLLQKGTFFTEELWRRRKDNTIFPSLTTAGVIKDDQGNPRYIAATAIDITERKQAEDALRESEERYRALLELSGEVGEAVVMLQDTDDKKAVHAFATGEWVRITGYSMEELLGMSWFELLRPDYREASLERYQRRMGGEVFPGLFEASIVRKNGTEVPVEITAGPTTYRGKFALVVYARDITGPKQAEQEREKLIQELQKTLQEVKTLSGLLPICAWCKKFRDDEGYWKSVEEYLGEHTGAEFTHGICPECAAKFLGRG